jgi:hypothetical protein
MKVVSVTWKLSMTEWHKEQNCLFWQGDYRNKGHNPKIMSWVHVPMKMVSVAQKLSMIEQHKEQNCLFQQGE